LLLLQILNKMRLPFWICHQKSERCFKINDKPMLLCSRCFGLYLFIFIGFVFSHFIQDTIYQSRSNLFVISLILVTPLFIDSLTQMFRWRESNNSLRFLTGSIAGFICGIDLFYLIVLI